MLLRAFLEAHANCSRVHAVMFRDLASSKTRIMYAPFYRNYALISFVPGRSFPVLRFTAALTDLINIYTCVHQCMVFSVF